MVGGFGIRHQHERINEMAVMNWAEDWVRCMERRQKGMALWKSGEQPRGRMAVKRKGNDFPHRISIIDYETGK